MDVSHTVLYFHNITFFVSPDHSGMDKARKSTGGNADVDMISSGDAMSP